MLMGKFSIGLLNQTCCPAQASQDNRKFAHQHVCEQLLTLNGNGK